MRITERKPEGGVDVAVAPARMNGAVSGPLPGVPKPLRTRQTRPALTALGVVLILGLGVLGGAAYHSAGAKTPVVVVIQTVPKGHVVTRNDLSTIDVGGSVVAVAGNHLDSVLGEMATVDLLPDTLLQRSMVSAGPVLAANAAQVGVQVTGGQIPADGLAPGDTVEVLALPAKGTVAVATPATATMLVAKAAVFSTRADPSSAAGTLVTLSVPAASAAAIATASGDGLVALVKVAS